MKSIKLKPEFDAFYNFKQPSLTGTDDEKSLTERVDEHLRKKQENRENKDAGKRTGGSRKEKAALKTILTTSDFDEIEKNETVAFEIVKKKRVFPPYDIEQLQNDGVSPGTAYLMDKIQKKYPAQPLKNHPAHRKIYIAFAEKIKETIDQAPKHNSTAFRKSIVSFKNQLAEVFLEYLSDVLSMHIDRYKKRYGYSDETIQDWEKRQLISSAVSELSFEFFNKPVLNFLFFSGKTAYKVITEAEFYDGVTKEEAEKNYRKIKDGIESRHQKRKEKFEKLKTWGAGNYNYVKKWWSIERFFSGGRPLSYYGQSTEAIIKMVEGLLERFYREDLNRLEDEKELIRLRAKETPPDWSWAFGKKGKKTGKSSNEIQINSGVPLSHIIRKGGYKVDVVNSEEITEKLLFKGVTIGNYMKDNEAKEHIRHFIAAITDLIDITDINQGVNRELSIGFGAYGRGGKAAATYHPNYQAINLTKRNGDGTVAHEFGHYLDHYMNAFSKNWTSNYMQSERVNAEIWMHLNLGKYGTSFNRKILYAQSYIDGVIRAFHEVHKNIVANGNMYFYMLQFVTYMRHGLLVEYDPERTKKEGDPNHVLYVKPENPLTNYWITEKVRNRESYISEYWLNSAKMKSKYWIEPAELFARAFEVYIYDKLSKSDRENNYLVSGAYFGHTVYPQGKEREVIYTIMDNLMKEFAEKEDLQGFKPFTNKRVDEFIDLNNNDKKEEDQTTNAEKIKIAEAEAQALLLMMELEEEELNY